MDKRDKRVATLTGALVGLATIWMFTYGPLESAEHRAYRLCRPCAHSHETIVWMIDGARESALSREELIRMWEGTYPNRDALETARDPCGPCVEAVAKVARRPGENP